jgi:hypothetical protein
VKSADPNSIYAVKLERDPSVRILFIETEAGFYFHHAHFGLISGYREKPKPPPVEDTAPDADELPSWISIPRARLL